MEPRLTTFLVTPGCNQAHLLNTRLSRGPLWLGAPSHHFLGSVRRLGPRDTGQGSGPRAPSSWPRALENLPLGLAGGGVWGPPTAMVRGLSPLPGMVNAGLSACREPSLRQAHVSSNLPPRENLRPRRQSIHCDGLVVSGRATHSHSVWAQVFCGFQKARLTLILKMHSVALGGSCSCHLHHRRQPGSGLMKSEISHENGRKARNCFCLDKSFLCLRGSIFGFRERVPLTDHTHSLSDTHVFLPLYLVTESLDGRTLPSSSAGLP